MPVFVGILACPWLAASQQLSDPDFVPFVSSPSFPVRMGPRIAVDEAHSNFHTITGRFKPFADLARADGYVVMASTERFDRASLSDVDLLVVANALHRRNLSDWSLPTPSAFLPEEVEAVRDFVESGGALLLIADHMPFAGAAITLAGAFGFDFNNGFAMHPTSRGPLVFRRSDGLLARHPVTEGAGPEERVDSVATFTGQAFRSPPGAVDLLIMPAGFVSLMPNVAWEFGTDTPSIEVAGWSQGSVAEFGRGRIAVFGEAAMFTAQRAGPNRIPVGMNAPVASQNQRFVTGLIRWLTGGS